MFCFLIHEANPQSRPVVITIFACVVCTSVIPSVSTFQYEVQARIVIATGVNVGLAEWIIDSTRVLCIFAPLYENLFLIFIHLTQFS